MPQGMGNWSLPGHSECQPQGSQRGRELWHQRVAGGFSGEKLRQPVMALPDLEVLARLQLIRNPTLESGERSTFPALAAERKADVPLRGNGKEELPQGRQV